VIVAVIPGVDFRWEGEPMRNLTGLLAILVVMAGCTGPQGSPSATEALPFPDDPSLWPTIRQERIRTLLGPAMERADVDAWIVLARENANDPIAPHVGAENAGGLAAFLFFLDSDGGLESLAISPETEATALAEVTPLDSVRSVPRGTSIYRAIREEMELRRPDRIAINSSSRNIADGLSWTQRVMLEEALGPALSRRLVSSEDVVIEWLSVKLPREVDIMRRAAALTEELELEAYARIEPGVTTDADVARYLKARMAELGVLDGWAPDQNPNVNSGPDRGHSHATEKVIRPGDVIQTDFGIRVHGMWVTDIQRFAYVLAPGEDAAPPEVLQRWRNALDGSRAAFEAMRPGATGWDVDRAQREVLEARGSIPIIWSTGHPVGYWAHDLGPRLGGAAGGAPPSGDAARPLRPGQTFAFDGFFGWPRADGTTKTISVEEMVVITESGAEWLIPPQEELILIRTGP
jgi:Xaa-Pro aminopeptidase